MDEEDVVTFTVTMRRDAAVWLLSNHGRFGAREMARLEVSQWDDERLQRAVFGSELVSATRGPMSRAIFPPEDPSEP